MSHYGLKALIYKQPLPISDNLGLTFWGIAYGRFQCINLPGCSASARVLASASSQDCKAENNHEYILDLEL